LLLSLLYPLQVGQLEVSTPAFALSLPSVAGQWVFFLLFGNLRAPKALSASLPFLQFILISFTYLFPVFGMHLKMFWKEEKEEKNVLRGKDRIFYLEIK
jgi:hypothetical protein